MSKTIRQYISNIQVEKSNLQHIADTGKINGSLLISIEKTMNDYSESQAQDLREQNAELLRTLQSVYNLLNVDAKISVDSISRILTKHNQLNKKS